MKILFVLVGFLSFSLAILGIFLPVLPTTPLLILSAYCLGKGSTRFHHWLTSSTVYHKYAKDFVENQTMPFHRKVFLLILASIMLLFPLIILDFIWKIIIVCVYIYLYYYFIFKIKTESKLD